MVEVSSQLSSQESISHYQRQNKMVINREGEEEGEKKREEKRDRERERRRESGRKSGSGREGE